MKDVKVSGRGHCGGILFACGLVVTVTKSLFQAQYFFFFLIWIWFFPNKCIPKWCIYGRQVIFEILVVGIFFHCCIMVWEKLQVVVTPSQVKTYFQGNFLIRSILQSPKQHFKMKWTIRLKLNGICCYVPLQLCRNIKMFLMFG